MAQIDDLIKGLKLLKKYIPDKHKNFHVCHASHEKISVCYVDWDDISEIDQQTLLDDGWFVDEETDAVSHYCSA